MLLTVSIKLLADNLQKQQLLASMRQFNTACNFISEYCFSNKLYSKFKIQKEIYYQIREKFDLPAQFAIRAISRVVASYKTDKKVQHHFKSTSSVEYDQRLLNWKKLDKISLLTTTSGRLIVPIIFGEYSKLTERAIKNSAKLIYRNKEFYLQAVVDIPEAQAATTETFLGIDLGITNIASTSNNKTYSSEQTETVRKKYNKLRRSFQKKGTKSAKKKLKKISKKERNFKKNTNHNISKQIVKAAIRHGKGIAIEDLQNFKKTVRKEQRDQFGKWVFGELLNFIEYKAKIAGVAVIKVNPAYTSQTCHKCGHCEKANRNGEKFHCKSCGYKCNADINAAKNIAREAEMYQKLVQIFTDLIAGKYPCGADVNQPIVAANAVKGKSQATNLKL